MVNIKKKFLFLSVILFVSTSLFASNRYALIHLNGSVNPVAADYIVDSIKDANDKKCQFIILTVDTPGGLVTSMRKIVQSIMASKIPVITFTSPKGAQAASAGGYIMISANIAVMAPGTEIGAMHPVATGLDFLNKDKKGDPRGIMEKKVLNDILAYGKSIAQERGRNQSWVRRAIKDAISSSARDAKKFGVIDFIARDFPDLLHQLNGRRVKFDKKVFVLNTKKINELEYLMDWKQKFVNHFADPQVVFILLIIAVVGLGIEFKSPGLIVPGVVGGISLFIFLLAIQILPFNVVGLIFIILAIVLFILELKFISYGLLTLGGLVSFILGARIIFDSPLPGGYISLSSIIAMVILILFLVFVVLRLVLNTHKKQVSTGKEGMIGETAVVLKSSSGKLKVQIKGEIWNAKSNEDLEEGQEVTVDEIKGMTLVVKK